MNTEKKHVCIPVRRCSESGGKWAFNISHPVRKEVEEEEEEEEEEEGKGREETD